MSTSKNDVFEGFRPLLFSIAYNMLENVEDSEDIVQETWLTWQNISHEKIKHAKAYLVKTVTNKCINWLNDPRQKRTEYIGLWLPEPFQESINDKEHIRTENYQALSVGMLVMLQRLTAQERAIFILRDVFDYDYKELAEIFDKTQDNCRQIFRRAKENLGISKKRFEVDKQSHQSILNSFIAASFEGNIEALVELLKDDIVLMADGGGNAITMGEQRLIAAPKPIYAQRNVAKFIQGVMQKILTHVSNFSFEVVFTNNSPAILSFANDTPICLVTLEHYDEKISQIFVQANPEKLKYFKKKA
jgi:RNA polymerase sigma-70 factor (ECF subfamily)